MLPIAIIGLGKIARDQHVPAIRADARFRLVGAVDPNPGASETPVYPDLASLIAAGRRRRYRSARRQPRASQWHARRSRRDCMCCWRNRQA